jgi:hypothetical protein
MKPDWHTLLAADPKPAATIHIRQSAACGSGPVFGGCNYLFRLKSDGSCCALILVDSHVLGDALVNVLVTDILGNLITTKDISTLILPDVGIFDGNTGFLLFCGLP